MFTLYPNTEAAWKMAVFAKLVSNHQPLWLPHAAPHSLLPWLNEDPNTPHSSNNTLQTITIFHLIHRQQIA
jgi:hypothetical protein